MPERKAKKRAGAKRTKAKASPSKPRGPERWLEGSDDDQPGGRAPDGTSESAAPGGARNWHDAFGEYTRRKKANSAAAAADATAAPAAAPGAPIVANAQNWQPLGPLMVTNGQTGGGERQPVAGRIAGLAVGPGGNTIYAASANGGVFVSTNGAGIWATATDIDTDPTSPASASLICGAIAIDPANPNRVFVGTGEGATYGYFLDRITKALPAYRGIGVLRTDDAGASWAVEPSSPDLSGQAFFSLAISPVDRECVVGATTAGLYRRAPKAGGQFEWEQIKNGVYSSVVVASHGGVTRFYCARWTQPADAPGAAVLFSEDGTTWTPAGNGFPTANLGRISLGLRAGNPDVVYAFVAQAAGASKGQLQGLYRLDGINGNWQPVTNVPRVRPFTPRNPSSQGNYDLAIAVDPEKDDIVYLGGSYEEVTGGASIWRCEIQKNSAAYRVASSTSIGQHAHSDVHVLTHSPNNPNELWCGCDGGVFLNRDPRGSGTFAALNIGLACLCCNFIAQHPTDPSLIITGLQDNGTAYKNGSAWYHVQDGDGGYCVINWADPNQVLVFSNGAIFRSVTGGKDHDGWARSGKWGVDTWMTMTQPIVGMPYDPANAGNANLVAVGVGRTVTVSTDFGASWPVKSDFATPPGAGDVFALAFASPTRLFAGTTGGQVFRADKSAAGWSVSLCEGGAGGKLGIAAVITDIAVDWADANLESVYVAFGSMKGAPAAGMASSRVWWFDGKDWHERSGTAPNNLLDVEHNALAYDRQLNHLYVAADIGVWHSTDGGQNWDLFQNGLPDAPVFDLQIHSTQRLLRASTYGRGVYEIPI